MGDVFKKQIVRWCTPEGKRCSKHTPGAVKKMERSKKWYGTVDAKQVPLCSDKAKSQQMLRKLLTDAALKSVGIHDPYVEHRKKPLADHLADFATSLSAKGNTQAYVKLVLGCLRAVVENCGWQTLTDLSASQAEEYLAQLRGDSSIPDLPPDKIEFTPSETAELLGTSLANVRALIKRRGLEATVSGKARRFPRATVQALLAGRAQGVCVQTTNAYQTHLKTFGNWLVRDRRLGENPFRHLEAGNSQVERRDDRRELTTEELHTLLRAARDSQKTFRGLAGWDRYHLYATACGTGFRASALASLTPECFDLGNDFPTVTLSARNNKSRKSKIQPLPPDLRDLLRVYLAEKEPTKPVWGGTWASDHRGAEMLRIDLEVAGIPDKVEGPDGPLFADFHALRHSFLTLGGRVGIDLRTLQELAGHSSPTLTARYSHRRLYDLAGAVEKLPPLFPSEEDSSESLRATGTDGSADFGCTVVAQTPDSPGHLVASIGKNRDEGEVGPEMTKPLENQGFRNDLSSSDTLCHKRGRRDSNPQPPDRQSDLTFSLTVHRRR